MVWLIVIALGALLSFCAMRMVAAANQNSRLPMIFGRAPHSPRRPAVFYLMLAASLSPVSYTHLTLPTNREV